eukprot:6342937-Pyramimonas_sp.AAC.1
MELRLQLPPLKPQRREFETIWTRPSVMATSLQSLRNDCDMRNNKSCNKSTYLANRSTKEREGKRGCISRSAQGSPLDDCKDRCHRATLKPPRTIDVNLASITKPLVQFHKVALPKKFCFDHEIGIDCLE